MKPLSTSESAPLHFSVKENTTSRPFKSPSNKIAWVRGITDKPNATFNITIKDALGRTMYEKLGCKSSINKEYGELINLETNMGEDLEVTVDGMKDSKNLQLFLN